MSTLQERMEILSGPKTVKIQAFIDYLKENSKEKNGESTEVKVLPEIKTLYKNGKMPENVWLECIDGRCPENGHLSVRIPGGGIGLTSDVLSTVHNLFPNENIFTNTDLQNAISTCILNFLGTKIIGHTDVDKKLETKDRVKGCGHCQINKENCEHVSDEVQFATRRITYNPELCKIDTFEGKHNEKIIIDANSWHIPSQILEDEQAFVYHSEWHQAILEVLGNHIFNLLNNSLGESFKPENFTADNFIKLLKKIAQKRTGNTVQGLAPDLPQYKLVA
jgi:hypothetical protein